MSATQIFLSSCYTQHPLSVGKNVFYANEDIKLPLIKQMLIVEVLRFSSLLHCKEYPGGGSSWKIVFTP